MAAKTKNTKATKTAKVTKEEPKKKKIKKMINKVKIYIKSSYNNTHITVADMNGAVLSKSSSGAVGFKGSKKSTAYAATKAAEDALVKASKYGVREGVVYISGAGMGRQAAVKGLQTSGFMITSLMDNTPIPHNGCRPRKKPRGS